MTNDLDRLYDLVPVVYRMRDADQGYPLRALLRVIAEQVGVVQDDIAHLYENWFIETCDDWVVPYVGALIGYTPVSTGGMPGTSARAVARERIAYPRREVANTIRFRRRKGTASLLEDLAEAVGGWPARAIEFYRLLAVTQNIDYLRMDRGRTGELRDGDALEALGTAFDEMARNLDVRRTTSAHARGTANVPDVGVFVWRLGAYPLTMVPAYPYDEASPNAYLFNPLGHDTQLFANPQSADPPLPVRITRRAFEARETAEKSGTPASGVPFCYGADKSLMLWTGAKPDAVAPDRIVPADLRDWSYRPPAGKIAVDPVLGRIVFPATQLRRLPVWVSYSYGFSADLGGGEYDRTLEQPQNAVFYRVGAGAPFPRIGDALAKWRQDDPADAVIEIVDSNVYGEVMDIALNAGRTLQVRAANGKRPVIRLSAPDDLMISGAAKSWFTLDGIVVTGRPVQIAGEISGVTIRHSTLVPGWGLTCDCEPTRPSEPSLEIIEAPRCVTIEHSIVGAIQVDRDELQHDPLQLRIADSIVDATSGDRVAIGAAGKLCADAVLTVRRTTVLGQIQTRTIELAEDSILLGLVHACRRQRGCIRFCYVPSGSDTPRRYECQPDLVEAAVAALPASQFTAAARDALLQAERLRVKPDFDGTRYGKPEYCRLSAECAAEITTGADDESEMGVFHDLYAPQRAANLRQRLDDYTPAGSDAGIIYAS
ncbi:MAG TPA: hypothetical protein VGU66_15630 [Candidatus Elarobacter sp.]|nr:hypothetical protein [Candidatus Elarobacter sp.]